MTTKYDIENLDCAHCAAKIESHLRQLPIVKSVSLNFATLSLNIDTTDIAFVRNEIDKIEPGIKLVIPKTKVNQTATGLDENREFRREASILAVSSLIFVVLLIFEERFHGVDYVYLEYVIVLAAYLLSGWNVLKSAFRTITKGQWFDENVLMTIATLGALIIHSVTEAVGVMIFYKIGELLQERAVNRSRKSIKSLLNIRPDTANRSINGRIESVAPEEIHPGEFVIVRPGEKVPLDGFVTSGISQVNNSAITGESRPVTVKEGDTILAGCLNLSGLLTVQVSREFAESSVAKILDLVENAVANKAKTELFITKFARYYTPAVVLLATSVALIPPLLIADQQFSTWIYRALVLLVISCPCALMVSIPLGYFGGIGGASRKGILFKGANVIDSLANVKTVVFDKTGTLTEGSFVVKQILTYNGYSEEDVLQFAAIAEQHSHHPIAKSILLAYGKVLSNHESNTLEYREISGQGVIAKTQDHLIHVGNRSIMDKEAITLNVNDQVGTVVYVAVDRVNAGSIIIGDKVKVDSLMAVRALRKSGVDRIVMLTGDNDAEANRVAKELQLDDYKANLLPEEKLAHLEQLISDNRHGSVVFVGDGINDAPVLARADVGIAMGTSGTDVAIESASVVLMTDQPSKVAESIDIGKRTRTIIWQNIVFALSIKLIFLSFGAFGIVGMWEAVFADMGTALLAVLNSTRALRMNSTFEA